MAAIKTIELTCPPSVTIFVRESGANSTTPLYSMTAVRSDPLVILAPPGTADDVVADCRWRAYTSLLVGDVFGIAWRK
jgi:hypothetical protein